MSILLSIIIPTKNRYGTLIPVIQSITQYVDMNKCEVVISDNTFDNSQILPYLSDWNEKNIKYHHVEYSISMVENTENAISYAIGEYFIFIGDDDFVSPYILDIVELIYKKGILSLTYPIANYFYANVFFKKKYAYNNPSTLQIIRDFDLELRKVNPEKELMKNTQIGSIFITTLPRLYHGIIHYSVVYKIKEKYGKFVPGPCPDMTLSAALSFVLDCYYHINYPVSISGASPNSEGGKGPSNAHVVKISDKAWLNQEDVLDWDNNIPFIFSRETIWAQCMSHVLRISDSNLKINYIRIYISMLLNCPRVTFSYINPLFYRVIRKRKLYVFIYLFTYFKRFFKKILFLMPSIFLNVIVYLRGDFKRNRCIHNLENIDECMQFIKKEYKF